MTHHLAEINIARFRTPMTDPANANFISELGRVNALAEAHPGFVWRLTGAGDNALDIRAFEDPQMAVNMSLWTGPEALLDFVYRNPAHREMFSRRAEWFDRIDIRMALWWAPVGHRPCAQEGRDRLDHLARYGATAHAFTFKSLHPTPDSEPRP